MVDSLITPETILNSSVKKALCGIKEANAPFEPARINILFHFRLMPQEYYDVYMDLMTN
jgi:hypothetical protein